MNDENNTKPIDKIIEKLEQAKNDKFIFLLLGRAGVGKSSTINSLLGKVIAQVGDWEPTTMNVDFHEGFINEIKVTVIDTPGLCDDLEEEGNDERYLSLVKSRIKRVDCVFFITRLDETRVSRDEKKCIKLITDSLGERLWKNSVIVFTFSNSIMDQNKYDEAIKKGLN